MRVDVSPSSTTVAAGEAATFVVTITNTEPIISAHRVTVLGADPAWVDVDQDQLSLFPDAAGTVTVTVRLPAGIPAGVRRLALQVREVTAPGSIEVVEVDIVVPAAHGTRVELEPTSITGGSRATLGVVVVNDGNAETDVTLAGTDADRALRFEFDPPAVRLAPGERATAAARVRGRRPFTGSPRIRQLTVVAEPDGGERVSAIGSFVQRPILSRGGLGLLGLLAALSVFAAVIATTFGQVVDRSQDSRDLVLQALRSGAGEGGEAGTGAIGGTVTLLTDGTPVAGVTVELFDADDLDDPLANVATGEDGTYRFDGLPEGSYKLRYRGAGFTERWFPLALDPAEAEAVELGDGEVLENVDIRLGGLPGSIAGTVSGADPAGATVSVRLPVDATAALGVTKATDVDPFSAPVVASTVVDAAGAFLVENLPSPSVYDVLVQKEGFATEVQRVNLSAGEERKGLEITLRRGDGTISGHVLDASGPLGGATVSASDGTTTVRTVSLTRDDVGAYTLRALPTPATYTVVISAPGHVTETLSVTLGVRQERTGLDATLHTDAGSISGRVSVSGGGNAGGIRVRATDGETTVETVTLSTGDVGSYRLVGLPLPGTYTVTFEREDLESQTRAVDLDDLGTRNATGVDATLVPATATLFGTVRDDDGNPLGEVDVVLTSGDRTFRTTTASAPPGAYEIDGLPPGTYSVSFERSGSVATALLVTLSAGERHALDAQLSPRASISGTVLVSIGGGTAAPAAGAQVRLFVASDFPSEPIRVVTTGADGRFSIGDLDAPESYVLDFAVGSGEPPQQSRTVVLGPGEARNLAAVELEA